MGGPFLFLPVPLGVCVDTHCCSLTPSCFVSATGGKQGKGGKGAGKGGGGKKKPPSSGQTSSKQKAAPSIQAYVVPSSSAGGGGMRALVGRNSRQNDHVTFSMAQPHELWFHAQGVPGSHVLLRFDAGAEVCNGVGGSGQPPLFFLAPLVWAMDVGHRR